jgi:hypothetical protein
MKSISIIDRPAANRVSSRGRPGHEARHVRCHKSSHLNTPRRNQELIGGTGVAGDCVEVTDPTHPLYQRKFDFVSVPSRDSGSGYVTVRYRGSLSLLIPRRCTSLSDVVQHAIRSKLTADAARELLALVKEHESCTRQPRKSGRTYPRRCGRKSSKSSAAISRR